ncbi:MAG TPA: hypothetical protein DGG94_07095 [Micromonosporaceae bacterium]|nr:hypothetical protein [Micromonosporaceae bacterium]HCU49553.1 hypothetical protein [Micromonosporaceae bacterium]
MRAAVLVEQPPKADVTLPFLGPIDESDNGQRLEFGLLGPLKVLMYGRAVPIGSPKHRILLAKLVLSAGRPVMVEELAEAMWGDGQPHNPRRAVQLCVVRLRSLLADFGSGHLIETCAGGYRIDVPPHQVDLGRFHRWLARSELAGECSDADAEVAALSQALVQWRGEPLADIPSDTLQREVAPQLREQRLQVIERRIEVELRLGRYDRVVGELMALTAQHPLRERFWAQLMTGLHGSGRRSDALNAYHHLRAHLAEELGVDPGEELQCLHAGILAGHAPSDRRRSMQLPPIPRQLPSDTHAFTGRVEELAKLDALLAERDNNTGPMIAVIAGTPGVGKTAFAAHWARRCADSFPDGQLWVNLGGYGPGQPDTPEQGLTRFLRALGVPTGTMPLDLNDLIGFYRSLTDGRRMLIVLDNANGSEQVRPLLPGAPGCLVLVTTRSQLTGLLTTEAAYQLPLNPFTFEEARQLLTRRLGAERVETDPQAVKEIISLCTQLPLSLAIAAAYAVTHPESALGSIASDLCANAPKGLDGDIHWMSSSRWDDLGRNDKSKQGKSEP